VLVLYVFPFWADTLLEEMVVGLQCELGGWSNVVLKLPLACLNKAEGG
jgi:hypothetical protein